MAPRSTTKDKILDVAEGLFAEHGFNDTSLR
ncbi:TetR/AcrR family transcriptional regulator, partial [Vibrio sp. 10N.222.51.A6]